MGTNLWPATSFPDLLPFEASTSTTLLMESLDYDWELIALSVEEHSFNALAQGLVERGKAHRTNYDIGKAMVCAKLAREARSRRARIWKRREEIATRREWIARERKRIDDEYDRRARDRTEIKSGMQASVVLFVLFVVAVAALTLATWR